MSTGTKCKQYHNHMTFGHTLNASMYIPSNKLGMGRLCPHFNLLFLQLLKKLPENKYTTLFIIQRILLLLIPLVLSQHCCKELHNKNHCISRVAAANVMWSVVNYTLSKLCHHNLTIPNNSQ